MVQQTQATGVSTHNLGVFAMGEVLPEYAGVKIEITGLNSVLNTIHCKVTEASEYWSNNGLAIGREVLFVPVPHLPMKWEMQAPINDWHIDAGFSRKGLSHNWSLT